MKVLVLGCGPAGLMAAHAVALSGHDIIIISKARKSFMHGAQYLHMPIPMADGEKDPFRVKYELRGSSYQYKDKVYGRDYRGAVSPEELTESHDGWDIRRAYNWLWETYGHYAINDEIAPYKIKQILDWCKPDFTISTIPANLLCADGHAFNAQHIWSTGTRGWDGIAVPENTVICNGEDNPAWYRGANIQGHLTVEWPENSKPPIPELHHVPKPISTNCGCFPEIVRMGRYGKWKKGVLSHEAFYDTIELLQKPEQLALGGM